MKQEKEKLIQDADNLNNAMRLFKEQKEAHDNLNNKSEKDIAIDLYLKFLDLESTFTFFQTNLASIDAKLLGVKDYSNDLMLMKEEVLLSKDTVVKQMDDNKNSVNREMTEVKNSVINEMSANKNAVIREIGDSKNQLKDTYSKASQEIQALKNDMINLQNTYSGELRNILYALKAFLTELQSNMQKTMAETFNVESKKYFSEMYKFAGTIDQKINQFNEAIVKVVDGKLTTICSNIESNTITKVETSVSNYISRYDNHIDTFKKHVTSITEKMNLFNEAFEEKFRDLQSVIEESYNTYSFAETVSNAVENGIDNADIEDSVSSGVNYAFNNIDISSEVENAFDSYRVTDKIKDSAKEGMEDCISNYSFRDAVKDALEDWLEDDLESKIREAINYEIGYKLGQIESDVSDIKSKVEYM